MNNWSKFGLIISVSTFCFTLNSVAQKVDTLKTVNKNSGGIENLRNVEKAYKKSNPQSAAVEYESLGDQMAQQKKYAQSNGYYNRALKIYEDNKERKRAALVLRKIAANNELQNKPEEAKFNYSRSSKTSQEASLKELNTYDLKRIDNSGNVAAQDAYLDQKLDVLEKEQSNNATQEIVQTKEQKAEIALEANKPTKAIEVLKEAQNQNISETKKLELSDKVAEIYASIDSLPAAIQLTENNIALAKANQDQVQYFELVAKLAQYYYQSGAKDKSINYLKNELNTAYNSFNTNAIINLTNLLTDQLIGTGNSAEALTYYQRLSSSLNQTIANDSFLFQNKLFQEIDQRVQILEQEKQTQTALYEKSSRYNIILIITLILTIAVITGIIWSLKKLKRKNLEILLQSLRREMNPHFIFNALNSVNQFIATNNERAANKYLSQYATLMRNFMSNSNKDFVRLQEEIESLQHYLALEHMRFEDIFTYEINISDEIDQHQSFVPNMLLQPFLENAIWHGLRYKTEKGLLSLSFKQSNDKIHVQIQDNGIGIAESKKLKTKHQQTYDSRGLSNIKERIATLNNIYNSNISLEIIDLNTNNQQGTLVILKWKNKNYELAK